MFIPTASYGKKWVLLTGGLVGVRAGNYDWLPSFKKGWGSLKVHNAVRQFVREISSGDASIAINIATTATITEIIREMAATYPESAGLNQVAATVATRWSRLPQTTWTAPEISDYFHVNSDTKEIERPSEERIWLAVVAYLSRTSTDGYLISPETMNQIANRLASEFRVRMARRLADIAAEQGADSYYRCANAFLDAIYPLQERVIQRGRFLTAPTLLTFTFGQFVPEFVEIFGSVAILV